MVDTADLPNVELEKTVEVTVKSKDGTEHTTRVHLFGLGSAVVTPKTSESQRIARQPLIWAIVVEAA